MQCRQLRLAELSFYSIGLWHEKPLDRPESHGKDPHFWESLRSHIYAKRNIYYHSRTKNAPLGFHSKEKNIISLDSSFPATKQPCGDSVSHLYNTSLLHTTYWVSGIKNNVESSLKETAVKYWESQESLKYGQIGGVKNISIRQNNGQRKDP